METGKKPSVLIVDDTPVNIDILKETLQDLYELRVALNGVQALNVLEKTGAPDLILLDIMMPDMDGFETCRRIKADERFSMVPVIFLTAKTQEEDLLRAFDLGGEDYITKPFRIPELLARIKTHMEIQLNRRELARKNLDFKEMLHILSHDLANPLANLQSILSIMADDTEGIADFLPDMSRTVGQGLEIIEQVRSMRSLEEKGIHLEPVNLQEAWVDSWLTLKYRFIEKGVNINLPEIQVPLWVKGEKISLVNSVLNNLLTNAVKFTPSGNSVTMNVISSDNRVVLSIRDEGIGIPDEIMEELFNPLSRNTHREGTDGEAGTGFGMPLVKEFMTAYGGSVSVNSKESEGTEILLDFLVAEPG